MIHYQTKRTFTGLAALGLGLLASNTATAATFNSNGTGGGAWGLTTTWSGGTVPTAEASTDFKIVVDDTVDAVGVNLPAYDQLFVEGTFNIGAGTVIQTSNSGARMNSGLSSTSGIVNITDGGSLIAGTFRPSSGSVTFNVSSGGSLEFLSATSVQAGAPVFNINAGGIYTVRRVGGTINLNGGTLINENGGDSTPAFSGTWTGGEYVVNAFDTSSTGTGNLATLISQNDANVLNLSNQATRQVGDFDGDFTITDGTIRFNVYSSTNDDNDALTNTSGGFHSINLSSDVVVLLDDIGPLSGVAGDYLGKSYTLFGFSAPNLANITPTLGDVVWNIGGVDYDVTFANTIDTDGKLTVSALTAVPEPASLGLLALGAAAMLVGRHQKR